MPRTYDNVDSKYRFIVLAAQRCRQLIEGAKPKINNPSKKPTIIAQEEVLSGLIDYYYEDEKKEDFHGEDDGRE
ncbi:MAG: DNA-directed RNA polymerase subunit omega [Acidobacteriota bacterium]